MSPVITTLEAPSSPPSTAPRLVEYQSTGEILQSARLQQGLSLDDIALQTFIKKNYLEALEEDRLEDLPAAVYSCGYIRGTALPGSVGCLGRRESVQSPLPARVFSYGQIC